MLNMDWPGRSDSLRPEWCDLESLCLLSVSVREEQN